MHMMEFLLSEVLSMILAAILAFQFNADAAKVVIQPKNPLIEVGKSLEINCTLVGEANEDSVSQPDFAFSDSFRSMNSSFEVEKLNRSSVRLIISSAQRNMSGLLHCHGKSSNVSDSTLLTVADKPKKPMFECRVHNWSYMVCSWAAQNDNGIPTNFSLEYNREHRCNYPFFKCPHYDRHQDSSCSWVEHDGQDSLFLIVHHCIVVYAINEIGMDYSVAELKPSEKVQPASVGYLNCSSSSSQSGMIRWKSPFDGKELLYNIVYTSDQRKIVKNITSKQKTLSFPLYHLQPNTAYQVIINCIPVVSNQPKGYWSKPESCSFRTDSDVPAMAPPVTAGGYHVLKQRNTDSTRIELFWQPLPRLWSNGEVIGYRINISRDEEFSIPDSGQSSANSTNLLLNPRFDDSQNASSVKLESSDVKTDVEVHYLGELVTNGTFQIDEKVNYWVTVEAKTSVGFNESLVPREINIPRRSDAPLHPDVYFVSVNSPSPSHFDFNWSSVDNASGYTIYWRRRDRRRLLGHYQWKVIDSSKTSLHLYLPNYTCDVVRFEISVESLLPSGKTVSSGMKHFGAVYFRDGDVKIPENIKFSNIDRSSDSQSVTWKVPGDDHDCPKSAFISHFIIRLCNATCHDNIVTGSERSATLIGLVTGTDYKLQMKSCSFHRESEFTAAVNFSTSDSSVVAMRRSHDSRATVVVVVCLCVVVAVFVVVLFCYHFYWSYKKTIKIVIPEKLSISNIEINYNISTSYASQLLPVGDMHCSESDTTPSPTELSSISSLWNSEQTDLLRQEYTNVSQTPVNRGCNSPEAPYLCATNNQYVSTPDRPNLPDYHRVMVNNFGR